ncbi:hypothetical protein ACWGLF_44415 [Streptomyces puniciscabiei]
MNSGAGRPDNHAHVGRWAGRRAPGLLPAIPALLTVSQFTQNLTDRQTTGTRAVLSTAFGDHQAHATLQQQPRVLVLGVAAVDERHGGLSSEPADEAGHGRGLVQPRQLLGDVVAVAAGQWHRERNTLPVGEDVVLAARPCALDRAEPASGPRRPPARGKS